MIKTILLTTRPQFLLLSLSVVLMATAIALYQGAEWSPPLFILILLGAVLSHAAVNMLNEYQDFKSGLDDMTDRTPFSGGSGALPNHPEAAPAVFKTLVLVIGMLVILGIYFIKLKGWGILPLGLVGMLVILTYTSKITRLPWLCLLTPGLAFGPLMVLGTYFVWTGGFSLLALLLSMVPFFLVNNLLLLNQVPDLVADKIVGRFNILMKLGLKSGLGLFSLFTLLAFSSLVVVIISFDLPKGVWLGLIGVLIAIPMVKISQNATENIDKLMPALRMNVIINLLTPILVALGLVWSL
ncbi:MAG: 1,4-dihydroxy-2-naphthoate polyprenyltransferase [Thiomicrorhabdus sp.]|nr:MAG: 1,4-dihydroxy-2-naphthoate polyprenyltransferase [Thiomicrorhabdus sp.]